MSDSDFDSEVALAPLKGFQRKTVDYVSARLLTDQDRTRQFLVADEVGLGKTMVARGVIARAIEAMWDTVDRIDIIYICSNGAIAAQNLARLNVMGIRTQVLPTRLTLLPLQLGGANGLRMNKVNFVSLTPGTTFDLKSFTGTADERALILRMIADLILPTEGAIRLFQVTSGDVGWMRTRNNIASAEIDQEITSSFRQRVMDDEGLLAELAELATVYLNTSTPEQSVRQRRDRVIARLRGLLAKDCAAALEPDLIILDEFQRFHDLLKGNTEAAELARCLFDFIDDEGNKTKTLLLSATPYRMLTLSGDDTDDGDHYSDFLEVMKFLFGHDDGERRTRELDAEMRRFRKAMQRLPASIDEARNRKTVIEASLRKVMARTERVSETADRDAMIRDMPMALDLRPDDLREARVMAEVAEAAGAPGTIEYWKSAPYLLSFMRGYKLRDRLDLEKDAPSDRLCKAIRAARPFQLDKGAIDAYKPIAPNNGRMRALMEKVFEGGMARRLWVPPSLPYFGPRLKATKSLVFSAWSMVPDAIAALVSHEAERQIGMGDGEHGYFDRPTSRPLQFREANGRLAGLRALLLVYPSPTLAAATDPLTIFREAGALQDYQAMREIALCNLAPLAQEISSSTRLVERETTWDWAGPALLDRRHGNKVQDWLLDRSGMRRCGDEEAWTDHVKALSSAAETDFLHGETNAETVASHLVDVALGSPAICALRALSRVATEMPLDHPTMLAAATRIGMGFRTLFNQPDTQSLLRAEHGDHYWRAVLRHCAENDLQSVLDEYVHVLLEAEGLVGHPMDEVIPELASAIVQALSLRPAQIDVDAVGVRAGRLRHQSFRMRGRFAMRLAPHGEDENGEKRTGLVRTAFNSPFRPFVLASTSVGQEGLDFHPYCHRIFHWNLPTNPVDLEQREGRINRYKSHAVRLNIASSQSQAARSTNPGPDPWNDMFVAARGEAKRDGDLEPFWLCEGETRIERCVLSLPFSREVSRLAALKRSVAIYRLAFGQPRQDDFMAWLAEIGHTLSANELSELQVSLRPE